MADTISFQDAAKIIRENPKEADALAFEYREFVRSHPEVPPADFPKPVLDGQAISEAYYYLREQHEEGQIQRTGEVDVSSIPTELLGLPILAASFFERPRIMQDDKDYQGIEERLKKEWLTKNPGKDFSSQEGLDYLHGKIILDPLRSGIAEQAKEDEDWEKAWAKSVDYQYPTGSTLSQEAEKEFRNNPKFQKRVARYDKEAKKIYKKKEDDPGWLAQQGIAQKETYSRLALLKKTQEESRDEIIKNEVIQNVQKKHQESFAQQYPEKARAYFQKIETEQRKQEEKEKTGVIVETSTMTHIPSSRPQVEGQAPQSQLSGRQSGGRFNRGINTINRLARGGIKNPFGKIATRAVVQTGLRGLIASMGPTLIPILITLIAVVSFTVFIVGFGGAPGAPPSQTTIQTPPTETTETATPTPAAL